MAREVAPVGQRAKSRFSPFFTLILARQNARFSDSPKRILPTLGNGRALLLSLPQPGIMATAPKQLEMRSALDYHSAV